MKPCTQVIHHLMMARLRQQTHIHDSQCIVDSWVFGFRKAVLAFMSIHENAGAEVCPRRVRPKPHDSSYMCDTKTKFFHAILQDMHEIWVQIYFLGACRMICEYWKDLSAINSCKADRYRSACYVLSWISISWAAVRRLPLCFCIPYDFHTFNCFRSALDWVTVMRLQLHWPPLDSHFHHLLTFWKIPPRSS